MNSIAPIALFTYNRINHTKQTVEALKKNTIAEKSQLFIYSDAPKNHDDIKNISEVREYIKKINGFKKITIIKQEKNIGLANSIIDGVTEIINKYGKIIVLEDDLVTSPFFLEYMNNGLNLYEKDSIVASIHGYTYPTEMNLPETFFLKGADCWGWGTWKRAWDIFEGDGEILLSKLKQKKLCREFNFNNTYPYTRMLIDQVNKKNDSWAIRWYASAFLKNKLTLYPGQSLIQNIGNDDTGTHCKDTATHDVALSQFQINIEQNIVEDSEQGRIAFEHFFRNQGSFFSKVYARGRTIIKAIR